MTSHFLPESHPLTGESIQWARWKHYLLIGLIVNASLWSAIALYSIVKKPSYSSDWSITLPPTSGTTNVNLPEIGAAYSQITSPYELRSQDPREIYKYLATSKTVLKAAAAKLNLSLTEFGNPRVKVIDNTTVITFEVKGSNPDAAQAKAQALYEALQAKLTELRAEESAQREASSQSVLRSAQQQVEVAQRRLADFKTRSGLNSLNQIDGLSSTIEALRQQRSEVIAQYRQAGARGTQLASNLKLSPTQAANTFALQTDPLFQKYFQEYSDSSGKLVNLSSQFLPTHPAIIEEKAKRDTAQAALLSRSQLILGQPVNQTTLVKLNPGAASRSAGAARESLSQALVTAQSEQQGFRAQAQELNKQINQLESKLKVLSRYGSTLQALTRDLQVAEAVFASTLANLDISKVNVFGSFPPVQMLEEPNLPLEANSQVPLLVAGGVLASLLISTGIGTIALRNQKLMTLNPAMEPKPGFSEV
ncbi:MAG: hypothetical protein VKJ46_08355 [Leptolyngbyaceae bacterium]|nr:hypothetical protein [Leptolyngbyaceae bacterium]